MTRKINILVLAILSLSIQLIAQNSDTEDSDKSLYNKNGKYILPESGDFSIGIGAIPYLEYFGNVFGKNDKNTLNIDDADIYGRYYLDKSTAVRFNIFIKNSNKHEFAYVNDDALQNTNPLSQAKLKDEENTKDNAWGIMLAYQKFRGYGRLRGFYGGQIGYIRDRKRIHYQYGNNITSTNQLPTISKGEIEDGKRLLEDNKTGTNNYLLGAFAGVEYYFAPKMAIGVELRLNALLTFQGQSNKKYEQWDGEKVIETNDVDSPGDYEIRFNSYGHGDKAELEEDDLGSKINKISAATIYFMFTF